jgi:hypothetical protein
MVSARIGCDTSSSNTIATHTLKRCGKQQRRAYVLNPISAVTVEAIKTAREERQQKSRRQERKQLRKAKRFQKDKPKERKL